MKRKLLALALCVSMVLGTAACGKDSSSDDAAKTEGKVTVGEYMGLSVSEDTATVTEEELQTYIDSILSSNKTTNNVEEGVTAEGDSAMISYTATLDGEEISTLSNSTGSQVTLSDDGFAVEGFADHLIGQNIGDTVEFDITLADDFTLSDYAGETIHYVVDIQYVVETVIPELTDEWVAETYEFLGLSNVEEFTEYFREGYRRQAIISEIWDDFVEAQTVESYDSEELDRITNLYIESFENQLSYYYGISDIGAYLEAMDMTEDDLYDEMEEEAKTYLKEKMVINYIADKENITIDDEEYDSKMLEYAISMGLESREELESYYEGYMTEDDYRYAFIGEKVQNLVADNAVWDEDSSDADEETTAAGEETTEAE